MRFLVLLTPGVKWVQDVLFHNQPYMPEHAVYVQDHYNQGKVLMAGPFGDLSGGAIVIDVENEEEIICFAEHDPAVKNGIFNYEIKKWGELMNRFDNRNPNFGQEYLDFKHKEQRDLGIRYP
ncbi:YciI family protein [Jeotgalibacillus proteolyticus]|uniref:YCII-related domain-containing protein n=1 Tax=Jeotgalibacillus proteolyticus TaxID=2082395 RepID=A0A2S5G7G1_9BACL|nr:YciI family protein [Jeotgalibacillus proteolyticus]PPA68919.1 hypothetical protein C4B60_18565 [Jeotgalibacillus proteolyticus]